jgi:2-polyprenyl-3-methyl-5-hydroxy-6-metoxy-1,4-benzoquinol methylase
VLDVGVGRGEMLTLMRKWGYDYQGIDISPSTIKFCKNLDLNCERVDSSTEWLYQNKSNFDLITCLDVIEHIPKDQLLDFLESCRFALRDNGKAIFQVPNLGGSVWVSSSF